MFKKKLDLEVLNKFNSIENKIDNINSKFDSITFLDGCCKCKERETKVNEMLITFLEYKFSQLNKDATIDLESVLMEVKLELQNTLVSTKDHNSSFEALIKINSQTLSELQDIKQSNIESNSDTKLRTDLNTFLVAIKDDLKSDINRSIQINVQNTNDNINILKETLINLTSKTEASFYDNEIIKIVEFKDATPEEQLITEVNPGFMAFNNSWLWPNIKLLSIYVIFDDFGNFNVCNDEQHDKNVF